MKQTFFWIMDGFMDLFRFDLFFLIGYNFIYVTDTNII